MSVEPQTATRAVLPRARHAAPRRVVREAQRSRMLEAMVQAVAEKGFARVVVADVIERAGGSGKTFYEQFANKDEGFRPAHDAGVDRLLAAIDDAVQAPPSGAADKPAAHPAPDWLAAARRAGGGDLGTMGAHPPLPRAPAFGG